MKKTTLIISVLIATITGISAKETEYSSVKKLHFPKGFLVYKGPNFSSSSIKAVKGPVDANIKAKFFNESIQKVFYITDWSWERKQKGQSYSYIYGSPKSSILTKKPEKKSLITETTLDKNGSFIRSEEWYDDLLHQAKLHDHKNNDIKWESLAEYFDRKGYKRNALMCYIILLNKDLKNIKVRDEVLKRRHKMKPLVNKSNIAGAIIEELESFLKWHKAFIDEVYVGEKSHIFSGIPKN